MYFAGTQRGQASKLLCRPMPWGSSVLEFDAERLDGGEPRYCCRVRLSYSEHVTQCELMVVRDGVTMPWNIGYLERTESHLRVKPRHFVRVEIWKLFACDLVQDESARRLNKRPARALPRDQRQVQVAITTKADIRNEEPLSDSGDSAARTERWQQVVSTDDPDYRLLVASTSNREMRHLEKLDTLLIKSKGKRVCVARKQYFKADDDHEDMQPFLGIRFYGSAQPRGAAADSPSSRSQDDSIQHLLSSEHVMCLLICLAWSSETVSMRTDVTSRFIQAMRIEAGRVGSAVEQGLSVEWDMDDVRRRLDHADFVEFAMHQPDSDDEQDLQEDEGDPEPSTDHQRFSLQRTDTHAFRSAVLNNTRQ